MFLGRTVSEKNATLVINMKFFLHRVSIWVNIVLYIWVLGRSARGKLMLVLRWQQIQELRTQNTELNNY